MTPPPVPPAIAEALSRHPPAIAARLAEIRADIFRAAEAEGAASVAESLAWGEPSYRLASPRRGAAIRLGRVRAAPDACAVLFHCRTTLIEGFRRDFAGLFRFEGTRALILPAEGPWPRVPLGLCLRAALTYRP
ncbi:MAG: hypothetical protein CML46_11740 [Rhodobacteraceae bacterium]|nr:hypothetical protein [Paracoccaceae bacterium]MBR27599.1 hypothetical protein [Paracoccaceae bacterium]